MIIDSTVIHDFIVREVDNACQEALKWVKDKPPRQAWEECEVGHWLVTLIKVLVGHYDNFTLREELSILVRKANTIEEISPHAIRSMVTYDYLEEQLKRRLKHEYY